MAILPGFYAMISFWLSMQFGIVFAAKTTPVSELEMLL